MAKKKDKVVIPETSPDETVIETAPTGSRYHAVFTPTWRPEIDCGDHDSVEDAQTAIERTSAEYHKTPFFAWRRESPLVWLATGHDGEVDTNMTIAMITEVVS